MTQKEREKAAQGRRDGFQKKEPALPDDPAYMSGWRDGKIERLAYAKDY